ncbi:hypothetical protein B5F14_07605 [Faecalitalea cylindroides]|uniref:Pesticidal crystal protein Cry22Aa Ig-like domain-containing protein n=1 Tax=Faecalitalea cylindroides TaxID=39483 RepID=A0A1Y4LQK7_9FIRM|nr:immunoglobulin-like domain-containing protein [Faecalitalea cylindroides]OUP58945.1 hypothetical protein B5F14_07605 [Faecalitalea cylindroides]
MEKRSKRRRESEEIQDLGFDLEDETIEEEEFQKIEEEEMEETSIDSDFREMPKVRIDAESDSNQNKKNHGTNHNSNNGLKWVLICILCIVLGVVIYGGYKVFFGSNNDDNTSDVSQNDTTTEVQDTEGPSFVGFLDRIVINLNAVDVDYSKYYVAIDNDQQMQVTVTGDVNLAAEGEYPITVSATDQAGNTTTQNAVVQVISEDTMVAIPLELTPMIDGSIPMAPDTKQRVDANVILYYYGEVSQEIQNEIARLGLDVSRYHLDTYWHPNDLNVAY